MKPRLWIRTLKRLGRVLILTLAACMAQEVRLIGPGGVPLGAGGIGTGSSGMTLTMTPQGGSLAINSSLHIVLVLFDAQGNPTATGPITWSSSNTSILTVDATGQITGVRIGRAVVTATTLGIAAN